MHESNENDPCRRRREASADPEPGLPAHGWARRLERARQTRDHLEVAQLMLAAAASAMATIDDDEALEHARWLMIRAQRSLLAAGTSAQGLDLTGELMERLVMLAQHWRVLGAPVQVHSVAEQVRDLAFDVARRVERLDDLGLRVSVMLRAAEALEQLGDRGDAHAMRARAFHRLGTGFSAGPGLAGRPLPDGLLVA